jgi:TorA maturation chaperone TorD
MSTPTLAPEDQARADLYALLARLFYAPPDEDLLRRLATTASPAESGQDSPFAAAWNGLARAAAVVESDAVREEFEVTFVGTGKALVTPYASAYLAAGAHHAPLVGIRGILAAHGLERLPGRHEPEDHIAALFETMRHLVMHCDIEDQRDFFESFVWPSTVPLCDAITHCEPTSFYRQVAGLAMVFARLEHESFQMD